MICVAISDKNIDHCLSVLDRVELAEIRLDLTGFKDTEIKRVFSHTTPAIATCRPVHLGSKEQLDLLTHAIESGARYVDIELEASRTQQKEIIAIAKANQCKVIISYHNFENTPEIEELNSIVAKCFSCGADIAKIATFSQSSYDNAKLLSLYNHKKPVVSIGMGDGGKITRIMAPFFGAEFTFASDDNSAGTAPGQISFSKMKTIISRLQNDLNQ